MYSFPSRMRYRYPPYIRPRGRRHGRRRDEMGPIRHDHYSPFPADFSSGSSESAVSRHSDVRSPRPPGEGVRKPTLLYSAEDNPYRCAQCNKLIYEGRGLCQVREKCTSCTSIDYCSECFVQEKHLPEHASHTFITVHSYPHHARIPEDFVDIKVHRVLFPIQKSILQQYSCFQRSELANTIKVLSSKPLWIWLELWTWLQKANTTPTNLDIPTLDKAPKIELLERYPKSTHPAPVRKAEPVLRNAVTLYSVTKQLKLHALNSTQAQLLRDDEKACEDPIAILSRIYDDDSEQLRQWAKVFMAVPGNAKKMLEVKEWKADLMALFKKDGRAAMDFVEALVEAREKESKEPWWSKAPARAAWTHGRVSGSPSEWMYQDDHWWRRTSRGF